MGNLFNLVFYRPVYNLLMALIGAMPGHDLGLAVIVLTVIVKVVLWPLNQKAMKSQRALAVLQPQMEALKKQYKDDQEKLGKEMMALYAREKVSPASSCLLLLVQLPVLIGLYHALRQGIAGTGYDQLYSFVANPGTIRTVMFGSLNLAKTSIILAALAAAAQFVQGWLTVRQTQPKAGPGSKDEETMAAVNKNMMYMMPVMTLIIGWRMPAGLCLYWFVMTALTAAQQYFIVRPSLRKAELIKEGKLAAPAPPADAKL